MKLMTALIVVIALTLPKIQGSLKQRAVIRKRKAELAEKSGGVEHASH